MLNWLARLALHYGNAFEVRGLLWSEYLRLKRHKLAVPQNLYRRIWRAPSQVEDVLNIGRFVSPGERILLLDLGGNVGEWASEFCEFFPTTDIVAFEPDPRACSQYRSRFQGRPGVLVHQVAISSESGEGTFHMAENSVYSSLQAYSETQADRAIAVGEDCTVALTTLDSFQIDASKYEATVLKIDVQGHEVDALLGASQTLRQVDLLIGEFSFATQYENTEPSFARACDILHSAGLYPAIFQCYGRQLGPYAFERDVVFVRRDRLDRIYGWE